ncbi:unnamed protein product [Microthlaspi erraticum]|uniref:Integrase catalytic domain-containing protein n=1 Tax=Microthlaspi erraticum TaxID=1685480 RepID=A0A6D2L942_9BRAS|nr:unnamed protein product [Microthlaspi erraticum]CAA7061188.1 unnamed protein product [Microthlaspi erraticum]
MTSPPRTPEHNGIAERRHRQIVETGLALLSHASMPKSYWTYAFGTAVYLINHYLSAAISTAIPVEVVTSLPAQTESTNTLLPQPEVHVTPRTEHTTTASEDQSSASSLETTSDSPISSPAPVSPSPPPPPPAPTRTRNRTRKPVQKLNLHTTVTPLRDYIPQSVAEALKDPLWRKAMLEEINSHIRNHTWHLVRNIDVSNLVGNRWIFTIKRKPDGSIKRYKARLVAQGYNQRPRIDYHETFSPVVKPSVLFSARPFLASGLLDNLTSTTHFYKEN